MPQAIYTSPIPANEPVKGYGKNSPERASLIAKYKELYNQSPIDVPMYINGKEVRTDNKISMHPPHDHQKVVGHFNMGTSKHVEDAIDSD